MNNEEDSYMQTFTGKYVKPLDLKYEDIDIMDIAHHLSLICRFNGACKRFYSVAQHSIMVANLVSKHDKLAALLHDASEAYMADVIRPIKYSIPNIKIIEDRIAIKILAKFNCYGVDWTVVKKADNIMLATERRDLMAETDEDRWNLTEEPMPTKITPWESRTAAIAFQSMAGQLILGNH